MIGSTRFEFYVMTLVSEGEKNHVLLESGKISLKAQLEDNLRFDYAKPCLAYENY